MKVKNMKEKSMKAKNMKVKGVRECILNCMTQKSEGGGDTYVAIIIVMFIVLLLGGVFKEQLSELLTAWFTQIKTMATSNFFS